MIQELLSNQKDVSSWKLTPLTITAIYFLVGAIWVSLTDLLLALWISESAALSGIQTIKSCVYILGTAPILYLFIRRWANQLQHSEQNLQQVHGELEQRVAERTRHLQDVNRRLRQEIAECRQTEQRRQRLIAILESTTDVISFADPHGRILYINRAGYEPFGLSQADIVGRHISEFSPAWANEIIQKEGLTTAARDGVWQGETAMLSPDGDEIPVSQVIQAHRTPEGDIEFFSTIIRDIRDRKAYEVHLEQQVNFDTLTGLPNRSLLQDRLQRALARARRSGHEVAVMFLDLDRFKMINDNLGHDVGDTLLQEVAKRLQDCVREEDTVARLGGDEFIVVLETLSDNKAAGQVARKVQQALKTPFAFDNQTFSINSSIGISLFPRDGNDARTLLKNADTALRRVKEQERNNIQFYSPAINDQIVRRMTLEIELGLALARGELQLHYQPKVELKKGRVVGVEALLRWQHPTLGTILPAELIRIAEETGMILSIGEWVLNTACTQAKLRHEMGLPQIAVSVNLSIRQFIQTDLPKRIARILQETGLEANLLELEITESQLIQDIKGAIATLNALKKMGLSLAVDDFGTGYSSLSCLKRFPLDRLKIDKAFVRDITIDPDDAAITRAVIALGHSLGLKVIAEGVETQAQLDFLQAEHCNEIQGYYFSEPLPAEALTEFLRDNHHL